MLKKGSENVSKIPGVQSSNTWDKNILEIIKELFLSAHADIKPHGNTNVENMANSAAEGEEEEEEGEEVVDFLLLLVCEDHAPVEHIDISVDCNDDW